MPLTMQTMQYLVLLSITIPGHILALQFSHFPQVSDRSDILPQPPSEEIGAPTGRPGLASWEERESLLAQLENAEETGTAVEEDPGVVRQRQKLSRKFDSASEESTIRFSRSKPDVTRPTITRLEKSKSDKENEILSARRKVSRRFKNRFNGIEDSQTSDKDDDEKLVEHDVDNDNEVEDSVTNYKVRSRVTESVPKRRKTAKKLKPSRQKQSLSRNQDNNHSESQEDSSELSSDSLRQRQRRFRVRPIRKQKIDISLPQVQTESAARRGRPRNKNNKEVNTSEQLADHVKLSRWRAADKDSRVMAAQKTKQTGNKYSSELHQPVPRLQTEKTLERQTIETLNSNLANKHREPLDSTIENTITIGDEHIYERTEQPFVSSRRPDVTSTLSLVTLRSQEENSVFLPTMRNKVNKKSRKRFRKVDRIASNARNDDDSKGDSVVNAIKLRQNKKSNDVLNVISQSSDDTQHNKLRGRSRGRGFSPIFNPTKSVIEITTTTAPTTSTSTTTTTTASTTTSTTTSSTTTTTTTTTVTTTTTQKTTTKILTTVKSSTETLSTSSSRPTKTSTGSINHFKSRGFINSDVQEERVEEVPAFDLYLALQHAEKTWAQDPFRKLTGLPGKPTFDIDFSKNPASNEVTATFANNGFRGNKGSLSTFNSKRRQTSKDQRRKYTEDNEIDEPLPANSFPSFNSNNSDKQIFKGNGPIESFLWTPALLRQTSS